jgi:hypothetical protein
VHEVEFLRATRAACSRFEIVFVHEVEFLRATRAAGSRFEIVFVYEVEFLRARRAACTPCEILMSSWRAVLAARGGQPSRRNVPRIYAA